MTRLEANRLILAKLSKIAEEYPDWRFTQIMENSGLVDDVDARWYEESEKTLKKIDYRCERSLVLQKL